MQLQFWTVARQLKKSNNSGIKVQVKRAFKLYSFFVTKRANKNADILHEIFPDPYYLCWAGI